MCARVNRILVLLVASVMVDHCHGQIDTEFWFAPPEVVQWHGDRPIYIRISTLQEAASVTIVKPALGHVIIAAADIPANSTWTFNLTHQIDSLETMQPATVMKTGIRITSTTPVSAYYEVSGFVNSDIFVLKGRNGLGKKFMIPAQTVYNNFEGATSSFDIVASQNSTIVTVRPTAPIVGHLSDAVITVKLNAGETYSFAKPTYLASDNPGGSIVESNKPIAITLKDDSVDSRECGDLLGDQLVPVAVTGTEYIVLKGFLDTPEFIFITATENNTQVFAEGNSKPAITLSAGKIFKYQLFDRSTYIRATKPVYVLHVTGFTCEMGMALLPSISCRGSKQIGFSRTTNWFFGLNLLVKKEGINSFELNGSPSLIPSSAFAPVSGTNDTWYSARLDLTQSHAVNSVGNVITNTQNSFQMGILNAGGGTCRYGYFSSFSTLFIGDDFDICEGDVATLTASAGKESYLWSTGETSPEIEVTTAGQYWVRTIQEDCVLYDTIKVGVTTSKLNLGPDRQVCRGESVVIDGKENFSWQWSDGSTERFFRTDKEGKYWLAVYDNTGCQTSDTIVVHVNDFPVFDLGEDSVKCKLDDLVLDATFPDATYLWQDGNTSSSRTVSDEGLYWVKVSANGCTKADSVAIANFPWNPPDSIFGSPSVCPFVEDVEYAVAEIDGSSYEWFVTGGDINTKNKSAVKVDWYGTNPHASVRALVTDSYGCRSDTIVYPVRVNVVLLPEIPFGPHTLCLNKSHQVTYSTPFTNGSVYQWKISGGEILSGQGSHEVVINWIEGLHRLWIEETSTTIDTVCFGVSPELSVRVFQDTTDVIINFVSVDTVAANVVNVNWSVRSPERVRNSRIFLHRRTEGAGDWEQPGEVSPRNISYEDHHNVTALDAVYEYQLSLINLCDEPVSSAIHNTMFLSGVADTSGFIRLNWNPYLLWQHGVDRYEVWRKTENDRGYTFLETVPGNEHTFEDNLAFDGFQHRYVIRALQQNGKYESWSAPLDFDFEHPVTIHNIITPNGDEFNQFFEIINIQLYRNSTLTIIDRWGREVFYSVNYLNDWDGEELGSGVYFYVLNLGKDNKVHKGILSILR